MKCHTPIEEGQKEKMIGVPNGRSESNLSDQVKSEWNTGVPGEGDGGETGQKEHLAQGSGDPGSSPPSDTKPLHDLGQVT